jgi:hypothetical protein
MKLNICSFFLLLFSCVIQATGQVKTIDCSGIRDGEFYFYPQGSDKKYKIIRKGSVQQEINLVTNDSSTWNQMGR